MRHMTTIIILGLLLALSIAAPTANLRFTYVATAGNTQHNGPNLNNAQEALFSDWLWAMYAPTDTVEGSPTFGQALPRNAANEAEAFRRWSAATWRGTRASMRAWKRAQEEARIQDAVVPE